MTEQAILLKLSPDSILVKRTIETKRIIEVSLKAPVAASSKTRTPVNLALVIDRSGSMAAKSWNMSNRQPGMFWICSTRKTMYPSSPTMMRSKPSPRV